MTIKKIGFIGLGNMGSRMVNRLMAAGHMVYGMDLDQERINPLLRNGLIQTSSVTEISKHCNLVMLSLPSSDAVEKVVCGSQGLLKSLGPQSIIIDFSTIEPAISRKINASAKEYNIMTLDAPVSGGPSGAEKGTLTIMVGGNEQAFYSCEPLLNILGAKVFYAGDAGNGQILKLCNNSLLAIHTVALAEALVAGVKSGVDIETLFEVFSVSSGNCWVLETIAPKTILKNNYDPLFALDLMAKDINLYHKMALDINAPSFLGSVTREVYAVSQNKGLGSKDFTAVTLLMESLANIMVKQMKTSV